MALTVSKFWSSKRLAEKSRTFQSIWPWQFNSLRNADPYPRDDVRLFRPRMQRDRRGVERQLAVLDGDGECFAELAWSRAQRSLVMQAAPAPHRCNAVGRLQGADQHRAGGTLLLADEIQAPMNAIGAIDIGKAGRAEHHQIARRRS